MNYDVDHFIKKFEAIHESNWCTRRFGSNGVHCAYGHCDAELGCWLSVEARALKTLFDTLTVSDKVDGSELIIELVPGVNDGFVKEYQQPTPKQRILAALYDIKSSISAIEEAKEIVNTGKHAKLILHTIRR